MVETGVSDKSSSAAEAVSVSGKMARVVSGAGLSGTPDEMAGAEGVMETLTRLMRVQSDMTAQAKAIAVQSLSSLACYTGEGCDATDDGLDRWQERFHERAGFAGWSAEEELYQTWIRLP